MYGSRLEIPDTERVSVCEGVAGLTREQRKRENIIQEKTFERLILSATFYNVKSESTRASPIANSPTKIDKRPMLG